jgi:hypothetical protein
MVGTAIVARLHRPSYLAQALSAKRLLEALGAIMSLPGGLGKVRVPDSGNRGLRRRAGRTYVGTEAARQRRRNP